MRIPHNDPLDSGSSGPAEQPKHNGSAAVDPERKCVLSGEHGGRDDLLRLAISPDGDVLPDALARAPGRGAWIGVSRDELETAIAKGKLKSALARAFKGAALTIPADLPERAEAALRRAFTDRLGLEMKSGRLLVGSDRILRMREWVKSHGWRTPVTRAKTARANWIRRGGSGARKRALDCTGSPCRWTGQRCLWHWAAITSSIWR